MYEIRDYRLAVENWINAQPSAPSRKQVQEKFPDAPQRIVRAALQSRIDRDRKAANVAP